MNASMTLMICLPAVFLSLSAPANTPLFLEDFETASSIDNWAGAPGWSGTVGNPGGAVVVSNNIQPTNKNFTVDVPLELTEDTDLTISFEALSLKNFAGVFHFYAEPEGFPQFFISFNVEAAINNTTYTPLSFKVPGIPASASFVTLRFEMITGAVINAEVSVAIDNLAVTGPVVDPEGTWKGYPLVDGFWAENIGQLGWLYVEYDPWIYSTSLKIWLYLPKESALGRSGVWVYLPEFE